MKKIHTFKKKEKPMIKKNESTPIRSFSSRKKEGVIHFNNKRITVETVDGEIFYIFGLKARGFVHGDFVTIEETKQGKDGKLPEARPIRLIKRSKEILLAEARFVRGKIRYQILDELGGLNVILDDIIHNVKNGDIFLVQYASENSVRVIRKFGNKNDPDTTEAIILFRHGARMTWPTGFEKLEVGKLGNLPNIQVSQYDTAWKLEGTIPSKKKLTDPDLFETISIGEHRRYDFRSWITITIDGEDAKDLDDAISLAKYENDDTLLAVHIADVVHYVEEGGNIDKEAFLRGTSIYTPGRVIPMLPEILSNDRCSLHPGEPKAVLSILMRIDSVGQVKESHIVEGIIDSTHRGTYNEVQEWRNNAIANNINNIEKAGWHKILPYAWEIYETLSKRRQKEGKIMFESTECYFTLDEKRNVLNIKKRERNTAHMLIEECMVLANEEVAKWCVREKLPFLSRVHTIPGEEQRKIIAEILENNSLRENIEPRHIREYFEKIQDPKEYYRLSRLLLPKMAKAAYEELPKRHFGLALTYYAHFTSPIRRYPDLLVHRIIKSQLHNTLGRSKSRYTQEMKKWGKSLSEKEKKAEEIERAIDALMMCRFMSNKIGETYLGTISGVTETNIYVELESGVEGSIFLGKGNGKYNLDPIRGSLKNMKGKDLYRIGETIEVTIQEVDMSNRRIEMSESQKIVLK